MLAENVTDSTTASTIKADSLQEQFKSLGEAPSNRTPTRIVKGWRYNYHYFDEVLPVPVKVSPVITTEENLQLEILKAKVQKLKDENAKLLSLKPKVEKLSAENVILTTENSSLKMQVDVAASLSTPVNEILPTVIFFTALCAHYVQILIMLNTYPVLKYFLRKKCLLRMQALKQRCARGSNLP